MAVKTVRSRGAGSVIRELRIKSKLSLRQLAKKLDMNQGTLSKYENDQIGLSFDVLDRMADALSIQPINLAMKCVWRHYK